MRSFCKNKHELINTLELIGKNPSVILLQEMWSPGNFFLNIPEYSVEAKLRPSSNANAGGGVAIFVSENIKYSNIKSFHVNKEFETIAIWEQSNNIAIFNVYIPHCLETEILKQYLTTFLKQLYETKKHYAIKHVIVGGDMNIRFDINDANAQLICTAMAELGLLKVHKGYTRIAHKGDKICHSPLEDDVLFKFMTF